MYITVIRKKHYTPVILLREGYREGGKVKTRTILNLTNWPVQVREALQQALRGGVVGPALHKAFSIARTRPHGHVAAVLGTISRLGLDRIIDRSNSRRARLVLAMIVQRVIEPDSKLACSQALRDDTRTSTLGEVLDVSRADEDDLYDAMDWLVSQQDRIERALARRHLGEGTLVLYDVSSAALEGTHCELGKIGYARDGVKGRQQVVYGLLTTKEGCPVAVQVFEGSTGDPATISQQVAKLKKRFKLTSVVLVGDRGMITEARLRDDLAPNRLDWITALRAPRIWSLVRDGAVQMSLFDQTNLAEVTHPDYPGERFVACHNPLEGEDRRRKREELLAATEADLEKIRIATERKNRPLRGEDKIGERVGRVIARRKMRKHFIWGIDDSGRFWFRRDQERIAREAALDGLWMVRTSVGSDRLSASEVVSSYKRLQQVERAFRIFNGDLDVRPIYHRKANRVRAHFLICMLAHYVEWHMLHSLAPLLFCEEDPAAVETARPDPVAPPVRSRSSASKAATKHNQDGWPVQSFRSLLKGLGTIAVSRIRPELEGVIEFDKVTDPTPLQEQVFKLLGVSPRYGAPGQGQEARPAA